MCGIFAFSLNRPLTKKDIALGKKATKYLSHRGNNANGFWYDNDKGVFLGHQRLSIIDLEDRANQPMEIDKDVISFNGEIYNFKKIKDTLKNDCIFKTQSDTEVLLHAWKKWEEKTFDILDGAYSFVLWDGTQLNIAVDNFSEKKIFYYISYDGVYFSSEINALKSVFDLKVNNDTSIVNNFMALGYPGVNDTWYENVYSFSQSDYKTVKDGKIQKSYKYWNLANSSQKKLKQIGKKELTKIKNILLESLENRLVSDVPLCLFLSSGVDSSLIAAMLKKDLQVNVEALTVNFSNVQNTQSEVMQAKEIASILEMNHSVVDVNFSKENSGKLFENLLNISGQPIDIPTSIAIQYMSNVAKKKGYKVGITGLGGDEVFSGYNQHFFLHKYRHLYKSPIFFKKIISKLINVIDFDKGYKFNALFAQEKNLNYISYINYPNIKFLKKLPNFLAWAKDKFCENFINYENLYKFLLQEAMPSKQLISIDHGSMSVGFEMRTPFLNKKLLEYLYNEIDLRILMQHGQKYLLREILKDYLPEEICSLKKQGFIFPISYFLDNNITEYIASNKIYNAVKKSKYQKDRILFRLALMLFFQKSENAN